MMNKFILALPSRISQSNGGDRKIKVAIYNKVRTMIGCIRQDRLNAVKNNNPQLNISVA